MRAILMIILGLGLATVRSAEFNLLGQHLSQQQEEKQQQQEQKQEREQKQDILISEVSSPNGLIITSSSVK
jgi:hypothetical protein